MRLISPDRPQRRIDPFAAAEVAAAVLTLNDAIAEVDEQLGRLAGLRLVNWSGWASDAHRRNLDDRTEELRRVATVLREAAGDLSSIHAKVIATIGEDDLRIRHYYDAMRL